MKNFPFRRLHGCGNSFIITFAHDLPFSVWQSAARKLLHPMFGLGTDGLMVIEKPKSAEDELSIGMFNPDGSPMGMCGNGIRCASRFLVLEGVFPVASQGEREIIFDVSEGRRVVCSYRDDAELVSVQMGEPNFAPRSLPIEAEEEWIDKPIPNSGELAEHPFTCVSMGNPHAVTFVKELPGRAIKSLGSMIENHGLFPERTNVEFAQIIAPGEVSVQVWERGAGATAACGTGACAVLAAGHKLGLLGNEAQIFMPGGKLEVRLDSSGQAVLKGPAVEVSSGAIAVQFAADCGLVAASL